MRTLILISSILLLFSCKVEFDGDPIIEQPDRFETTTTATVKRIFIESKLIEVETDTGILLDCSWPEDETLKIGDPVLIEIVFEGDQVKNEFYLTDATFEEKI